MLDAIRLDVFEGETLVILGGSGSGKSTLLRLMIGNVTADGGDIIGLGKSLASMTDRRAGRLPQVDRRAVPERGAVQLDDRRRQRRAAAARAHRSAGRDDRDHGEDQARAGRPARARRQDARRTFRRNEEARRARPRIALDPKILFYDEPSAGLDPVTSAEIDQLIIDLNKKLGVTSVVVTHEMDSAFRIADRMVLLDRGKFIVSGTPDEMQQQHRPARAAVRARPDRRPAHRPPPRGRVRK